MRKSIVIGSFLVLFFIAVGAASFHSIESSQANPQEGAARGAVITGSVVTLEGRRVAGADVSAMSTQGSRGILPHTITDPQGNFSLGGLKAGTYYIEAKKESEGYASTLLNFFSDGLAEAPQIEVLENQVVNGVILRFGPKSASLTGRVIDAITKKPIQDAQIILRRADNPKRFYSTGPNDPKLYNRFKLLVPPAPFTIEVKATGYEDWTYSNDGSGKHADVLRLVSGSEKDLTIALHPVK